MTEKKKNTLKIKDMARVDRPREKLAGSGPSAMKDEELLAIMLRTGFKGKNVMELARGILREYDGDKLLNAGFDKLSKIKGIGPSKAAEIVAAFELTRRMTVKDSKDVYIRTPEDAYGYVPEIRKAKKEKLVVIYLTTRNAVIKRETVSIGSLNANIVHPREVFSPALNCHAASVIMMHNHPSGDASASEEDIEITRRIVESGKILGIEVLDHVIVCENDYKSMKEEGLI